MPRFEEDAPQFQAVMPGARLQDVTMQLHEEPECLDGTRLLRPEGASLLSTPLVRYWRRNRAWGAETRAGSSSEALALGRRLQKALVARRSLTAADPYFHEIDLYLVHAGGVVRLPPHEDLQPKARDTTKSDARHKLQRRGEGVFGARGFKLGGHEGAYTMELIPYAKEWRGKFSTSTARGANWEELGEKLDRVLVQLGVSDGE